MVLVYDQSACIPHDFKPQKMQIQLNYEIWQFGDKNKCSALRSISIETERINSTCNAHKQEKTT